MTCKIPYIEIAAISDSDKESKRNLHLNSVRELLEFQGLNFKTLVRKIKKDGQTYSVLLAPKGGNETRFELYVENSVHLKNTLKFKKFANKDIIVIDVFGDTELSDGFSNPLSAENYLREGFSIENSNVDLQYILDNEESREELYKIINAQSGRLEELLKDKDLTTSEKKEIGIIKNGMDDINSIYSVDATTNFLTYALNFADRFSKKFEGKKDYLKQLQEVENLPTFEERKTARASISRKIDYIKNKFYIFGMLNKIADQLSFASLELNDVFEVYNRYTIQRQLEDINKDSKYLKKVEKLISGDYKDKLELKYQIEQLNTGLTSSEIDDLMLNSVYKSMIDKDGNIKQTLLSRVKDAQDKMTSIQNNMKKFFIEAQVNLLYDTYITYLPQKDTAYAKTYGITKEKIRNSILQANGNIGMFDYGMKHGNELPDEVISLFTTLLQSTIVESDYQTYKELSRLNAKFGKAEYKGREEEFSDALTTYSFELTDKWNPQFYTPVKRGEETFLTYTVKTAEGEEIREFPLPKPSAYDRYYKLDSKNDDNWAYLTDQGFYVRVQATKAIEGKNNSHRIDIEENVLRRKIDEIANFVLYSNNGEGSEYTMYSEDGINPTIISPIIPNTNIKANIEYVRGRIWDAFNSKYIKKQGKEESLEFTNELYNQLLTASEDVKTSILKENFKRKMFSESKEDFFKATTNRISLESTYLAALNLETDIRDNQYLVENKDGDIIPVNVIKDDVTNKHTILHKGKVVKESDIEFFLTKGDSFKEAKFDTVIQNTAFSNKLQSDKVFAEFYKDVVEEYEKLENEDSSGHLTNGKLGQIANVNDKSFMQAVRDFAASNEKGKDLANNSYEALKKLIGSEQDKKVPKTNKLGQFVDYNGEVLPPGSLPIMIDRPNLNIDRLNIDKLSPTFANRIYDQNLVTNNILTNIMTMSTQAINFNNMYELEPQMKFALLLSEGSGDLGISPRQLENISKSKGKADYETKNATQAAKTLNFIINAYGYNNPLIKDSLGRATFGKWIEPIRKLAFFQQIALNINAMFPNIGVGQINNYLVASSRKFGLDEKFVTQSQGEVIKNLVPILAGTVGHVKQQDAHWIVKVAYLFNSISGLALDAKEMTDNKDAFKHYASFKSLYLTTSGAEVINQVPLMLGFLKSMPLEKGGSMYDAIRVDGKKLSENPDKHGVLTLENEDGSEVDEKEVVRATLQLSKLNSEAQGDQGKLQKIRANYEFIPSLALTYARWLVPTMRKRFGKGSKMDTMTGEEDFGGYQRTFMANSFGTLDEFKEMFAFGPDESFSDFMMRKGIKSTGSAIVNTGKVFASVPFHVLNLMTGFKGTENATFKKLLNIKDMDSPEFKKMFKLEQLPNESIEEYTKRLEAAYDFYINSLQTAAKEYTIILAWMIIGMMLGVIADDEEDDTYKKKVAKFLEVRSRQLVSDLSLGAPLVAPLKSYDFFSQRSKDPLVILRTIETNSKLFLNLVGFQVNPAQGSINFNIDDTYDKSGVGYEKGDLKLEHNFRKALGPWNQFYRIITPQQQENYLKLIDKGAIFTDKDLEEEE